MEKKTLESSIHYYAQLCGLKYTETQLPKDIKELLEEISTNNDEMFRVFANYEKHTNRNILLDNLLKIQIAKVVKIHISDISYIDKLSNIIMILLCIKVPERVGNKLYYDSQNRFNVICTDDDFITAKHIIDLYILI